MGKPPLSVSILICSDVHLFSYRDALRLVPCFHSLALDALSNLEPSHTKTASGCLQLGASSCLQQRELRGSALRCKWSQESQTHGCGQPEVWKMASNGHIVSDCTCRDVRFLTCCEKMQGPQLTLVREGAHD